MLIVDPPELNGIGAGLLNEASTKEFVQSGTHSKSLNRAHPLLSQVVHVESSK